MKRRGSRTAGIFLTLALSGMALMFLTILLDGPGGSNANTAITGFLGIGAFSWLLLRGPVGKAIAGMLEGGTESGPDDQDRLAELEHRFAELEQRGLTSGEVEQAYARLAEMEDRVEFAERMLTQQRESLDQLPRGGGA